MPLSLPYYILNDVRDDVEPVKEKHEKDSLPLLSDREEQDLEYARLIQEEILRCAEETQRREQDDEVSTNLLGRVRI